MFNQEIARRVSAWFEGLARQIILVLVVSTLSIGVRAQENCANGIDDDGDGLIDLNDSAECICQGITEEILENLIPNPSFEEYIDCPTWYGQMQSAVGWDQATDATSDLFNSCGMMWESIPQPLPDGDGCVGAFMCSYSDLPNEPSDYFEYVGACLNAPMEAGVSYELQFSVAANNAGPMGPLVVSPIVSGPVDVTIYGYETCGTMPEPTLTCPVSQGWYVLGTVTYQPENAWSVQTVNFVPPQNTMAIMIGAPCEIDNENYVVTGDEPYDSWVYFFYDDLHLGITLVPIELTQTAGPCAGDLVISAEPSDLLDFQWYHEGIALIGETSHSINLGDESVANGTYQLMVTNPLNGTCDVLETEVLLPVGIDTIAFEANVTSGCAPLEVHFELAQGAIYTENITWDFEVGSSNETNPAFLFTEPGLYNVTVTGESEEGCTGSLTLENLIEVLPQPAVNISYEVLEECNPFVVSFSSDAPPDATLNWDFGPMGNSNSYTPVWSYDAPGAYGVALAVTGANAGCGSETSIELSLEITNPPIFQLIAPESICEFNAIDSIKAIYDNGYISWLDGSNESYLPISAPGMYHAVYTNSEGCQAIDSVNVPMKRLPEIHALDHEACDGSAVELFAESNAPIVYWEGISNGPYARVSESGWYTVVAENECGFAFKEIEVVLNDCSCQIYIPNAFTPNGDGVNDLFRPAINCDLQFYELRIFDRWGQEVFVTNDPQQAWNGASIQNSQYSLGTSIYNYMLIYDSALNPLNNRQTETGFIQLLR